MSQPLTARRIRFCHALKRTAASVRLSWRAICLLLLRPASALRSFTSAPDHVTFFFDFRGGRFITLLPYPGKQI